MSRSALWRQENNVKERQRHADEVFQNAILEGRVSPLLCSYDVTLMVLFTGMMIVFLITAPLCDCMLSLFVLLCFHLS